MDNITVMVVEARFPPSDVVAVMVVEPMPLAVTRPLASMVAAAVLELSKSREREKE